MERAEIEQDYSQQERQVRVYLLLACETIKMFHYLSRDMPTYFIKEKQTDMVYHSIQFESNHNSICYLSVVFIFMRFRTSSLSLSLSR
jgi:hypothetical protein